MSRGRLWACALALALSACVHLHTTDPPPFCAAKLGEFAVHASNTPRFGTPITSGPDGAVYIVYITPALETVIRRYDPPTRTWSPATVLSAITQNDPYHTQPSVGIDLYGHVHAAYNHHNTPWQYRVSRDPHDVAVMEFRGQDAGTNPGVGDPAKANCTGTCRDNWLRNEPGIAALPGNQITYPSFGATVDGSLFLAFRECLLCDADFHSRQWSAGLVRYHLATRTWSRVAGIRPWATEPGKLPVGVRLAGDSVGWLHAAWLWCNAYTEQEGGHACFEQPNFISYARSPDLGVSWQTSTGKALTLPLGWAESEVVSGPEWFDQAGAQGYYGGQVQLTVDTQRVPLVTVFPEFGQSDKGIKRSAVIRQAAGWSAPQATNNTPALYLRDQQGRWIGVSGGMRVHVSRDGQTWQVYELALDDGPYVVAYDPAYYQRTGQLRLYANNKEDGTLAIWDLTWPASGRCSP